MSTIPVPYSMGNGVKIVVLGMQKYKRSVCLWDHFASVLCKFYKFLVILIIKAKKSKVWVQPEKYTFSGSPWWPDGPSNILG